MHRADLVSGVYRWFISIDLVQWIIFVLFIIIMCGRHCRMHLRFSVKHCSAISGNFNVSFSALLTHEFSVSSRSRVRAKDRLLDEYYVCDGHWLVHYVLRQLHLASYFASSFLGLSGGGFNHVMTAFVGVKRWIIGAELRTTGPIWNWRCWSKWKSMNKMICQEEKKPIAIWYGPCMAIDIDKLIDVVVVLDVD